MKSGKFSGPAVASALSLVACDLQHRPGARGFCSGQRRVGAPGLWRPGGGSGAGEAADPTLG